jgi:hypothetical protein
MWRPRREDRLSPCRYEAARVELPCAATPAHVRSLILEHAMLYADGWAPLDRGWPCVYRLCPGRPLL